MTDWKKVAEARSLGIPPEDLERIRPSLEILEAAFAAIKPRIPATIEPAVAFCCPPRKERP